MWSGGWISDSSFTLDMANIWFGDHKQDCSICKSIAVAAGIQMPLMQSAILEAVAEFIQR